MLMLNKDDNSLTFLEFFEKYWTLIVQLFGWDNSTRCQNYLTIKNLLAPLLIHKPMCELQQSDYNGAIENFVAIRAEQNKREYSSSHLMKIIKDLSVIAEFAYIIGYCATNPLSEYSRGIKLPARAQEHRRKAATRFLNVHSLTPDSANLMNHEEV